MGFDRRVETSGGSSRVVLEGAAVRDARFETNAGSALIDLRGVRSIADLDVHANLGSTTIRLPERSLAGSIAINADSAAVCLPPGAGLRVELDVVAGSADLAGHGLVQTHDDVWESPGFAAPAMRLELRVDVNAGSLALDPARECAG